MIVARLKTKEGKLTGSCKIAGYSGEDGWFPASSFNFGFNSKEDTKAGGGNAGGAGRPGGGGARAGATTSAPTTARAGGGGQGGKEEKPRDFTGMSISKEVDVTTCDLMAMAMRERKSKQGAPDKTRTTADIHVLSSRQVGETQHIYASLKIHLAGVIVQQWSISGSGDERPTEELQLQYDKAAMLYQWTDGRFIQQYGPRSWDQDKNDTWSDFKGFDAI